MSKELKEITNALQMYFDDNTHAFLDSEWYEFQELWKQLLAALKEQPCETCMCMDCGKAIKVAEQSKHLKECPKSYLQEPARKGTGQQPTTAQIEQDKKAEIKRNCSIADEIDLNPLPDSSYVQAQPQVGEYEKGFAKILNAVVMAYASTETNEEVIQQKAQEAVEWARKICARLDQLEAVNKMLITAQPPAGELTSMLDAILAMDNYRVPVRLETWAKEARELIDQQAKTIAALTEARQAQGKRIEELEKAKEITHQDVDGLWKQITTLQKEIKELEAEKKECCQVLEKHLDRDKDPKDSLRDLVVVLCNALYWARAKKKHIAMGRLQAKNNQLQADLAAKDAEIENILKYLAKKIKHQKGYIESLKRVAKQNEFYDQAQTNIMETEQQVTEYEWIYKKLDQALREKGGSNVKDKQM